MKQLMILLQVVLSVITIHTACAAKLAIVIDDFGYREHNDEQVLALSTQITVAVLPNSLNATHIATLAHLKGNDVIIHLPMAPMSKQPLEVDTLIPTMSDEEIHQIINEAIKKVPYAVGINNHMGSLMTSNRTGMQKVMKSLSYYPLFFLDSKTIATSQAIIVAHEYRVATAVRDVFLDDAQDEQSIAQQFDLAVKQARKNGSAIVIGHPYAATVKVLREKLAQLPDDLELVKVSTLIQKPAKVKLSDLVAQYRIRFEQALREYVMLQEQNGD